LEKFYNKPLNSERPYSGAERHERVKIEKMRIIGNRLMANIFIPYQGGKRSGLGIALYPGNHQAFTVKIRSYLRQSEVDKISSQSACSIIIAPIVGVYSRIKLFIIRVFSCSSMLYL